MSAIVAWFKAAISPASSRPSSQQIFEKEAPLFAGYLGCFSPSVDQAIRVLWVKHGGTLTHTEADFKKAQFFFCMGMDDPWLKELLWRSLIVRHASWVTLCIAEKFLMPIARYTLDDGFDESKIRILNSSTLSPEPCHPISESSKDRRIKPESQSVTVETGSRKRRVSQESESQRPKKKARIDTHDAQEDVEGRKRRKAIAVHIQPTRPRAQDADGLGPIPTHISFIGRRSIPPGKVSRVAKAFESRIRVSKPTAPLTHKEPTEISRSPLNPHTLFWNDLLAKNYAKEVKTLTFSVNDLLLAPETKAVIFDVNKTYLGRNFINMEYA